MRALALPSALHRAQQRFLSALMEPLAGEARSRTELPPGERDVSVAFRRTANSLLRSTATVPATERLDLYHRQYWYRLLDSLADDFPHLQEFLGRERFWSLLERYLTAHPPTSHTLRDLGAGLAEFARGDPGLAVRRRAPAADLARCEYALMEVFAAPDFRRPTDADFNRHPIRLAPTVRLLAVSRAVSSRLHSPDDAPGVPGLHRALLVVWRDEIHRLRHVREPLSLLPILESLRTGGRLDDILARVRRLPPPADIKAAFARWRHRDWFALA